MNELPGDTKVLVGGTTLLGARPSSAELPKQKVSAAFSQDSTTKEIPIPFFKLLGPNNQKKLKDEMTGEKGYEGEQKRQRHCEERKKQIKETSNSLIG